MKPLIAAVLIAALLAVIAAEAYRWLLAGSHLALLAVVFVACLASALATMRLTDGRPRARSRARRPARPRGGQRRETARREGGPRESGRREGGRHESGRRESGPREGGTVKWFSRSKGFGFIIREDGDEIFVHHRSVRSGPDRRGNLRDGQRVTFVAVERSKGWQAEDVAPADD